MLGDSVMLGSKAATEKELAGWDLTFDAAVNRSTLAGAQIATARRSEIHDIIVIQLGTNDGGNPTTYASRVDAVMKALDGVPYVVWLTIHEARPYYKSDNDVLRQKATQYPNMRVADWNAVANATPGGMVSDGLHLNATGAAGDGQARAQHDRGHLREGQRRDRRLRLRRQLPIRTRSASPQPRPGARPRPLRARRPAPRLEGHVFGFGAREPRRPHNAEDHHAAGVDPSRHRPARAIGSSTRRGGSTHSATR